MRCHFLLPSLLLACTVVVAACSGSGRGSADVRVTSMSPAPGSFSASRRVEVRTVFDADVDPASISPATCRIERVDGGGPEAATTAYDASSRLLTITPVRSLSPLTAYEVVLTRELRAAGGAPFAAQIEWSFTTDGNPVWERGAVLAPGRLLSVAPSRLGGVLALWAAPDETLHCCRGDGTAWAPPAAVGIADVLSADIADDGTGRVVVAAITQSGSLRVASAVTGFLFAPAEEVATSTYLHVDVDASDSGHLLLAAGDAAGTAAVRMFVPGAGWILSASSLFTIPHVRLAPAGDGVVVGGFAISTGLGDSSPRCVKFTVDALGAWTQVDPFPASVWGFGTLQASKARFREDRFLVAPTAPFWPGPGPMIPSTPLFERTAWGWQPPGVQLGPDPRACDIAQGPLATAAVALIEAGARPVVRRRLEVGFTVEVIGTDGQPAPANPTVGVAITDDFRTHVLWTAAVDDTPAAEVHLLATWLGFSSQLPEPLVVDGPFAPEQVPIQDLRVVSFGAAGAAALWTRQGEVRYSAVR